MRMSTADLPEEITKLSFEEAANELEAIVRKLESGQGDLEASIADYTRGTQLRQHCQTKLDAAKLKVEKLIQNADGSVSAEPFDAD